MTPPLRLALFVAFAATLPLWLSTGDLFNYGIFVLLYVLLGLGLNVVVGFAGLLDLGYVAFFGFGAYFYALLSSEHYGIHWPAIVTVPLVVVSTALPRPSPRDSVAAPPRRLPRDRDALLRAGVRRLRERREPDRSPGKGLTGGPNGIADIDPLSVLRLRASRARTQQYYVLLVVVRPRARRRCTSSASRGRAAPWRAHCARTRSPRRRSSIPVNRLKLLAFAFGSGIAGLTGCIFAAGPDGRHRRELRHPDSRSRSTRS